MQTNGFYVNGACGSLFKKQIISSFISVILIKFRVYVWWGEWREKGCVIHEVMIKSNLSLQNKKQLILSTDTLVLS